MNRVHPKSTWLERLRRGNSGRFLRVLLAALLTIPVQPALLFAQAAQPQFAIPAPTSTVDSLDLDMIKAVDVDPQTGALIAPVVDLKFGTGRLAFEISRQFRVFDEKHALFGKGWSSSLSQRLEGLGTDAVCFVDASGHRRWFEKNTDELYIATRGLGSRLAKVDDSWVLSGLGDAKLRTFSTEGQIRSLALRSGLSVDFSYANNKLIGVKSPFGQVTLTHNSAGAVNKVVHNNKTWTYVYNDNGQLSRVIQPSTRLVDYSYDLEGQLTGIGRHAVTIEYDSVGRVTALTGKNLRTRKFSYIHSVDPWRSYMTLIEDGSGRLSLVSQSYDGRLIETVTEEGERSTLELDERDRPIALINAIGQKWEYGYDSEGRPSVTEEPNGVVTVYEYQGKRMQASQIKRGKEVYNFTYDDKDRLTAIKVPSGATETFEFDKLDRVIKSTDIRGLVNSYQYDLRGFLTSVSNNMQMVEKFNFDQSGQLVSYTRPDGTESTMAYDNQGQLTKIKEAHGREMRFEYNSFGQISAKVDDEGRRTDVVYNQFGDVSAVSDGAGLVQAFEYDKGGRLKGVTDANGNQTRYGYEESKFSVTDAQGSVRKYLKNKLGNLTTETLPNGKKVHYSYNKQGLLSQVTAPNGQLSKFSYDKMGRLTFMGNVDGQYGFKYDDHGRIQSLIDVALKKAVSYEYNGASDRTAMILPFGRIEYDRDALGRIKAIKDIDGKSIKFEYNLNSQRSKISYPNGVTTKFAYDKEMRLTSIRTKNSADKILSSRTYSYDELGRRASSTDENNLTQNYSYDERGRLTEVQRGKSIEAFTYDNADNRTSVMRNGKTQKYVIGKNNQVLATGSERFTYDSFGRIAKKISRTGIVNYQYDHNDKLIKLTKSDGTVIKYGYAPNGTRVWRERNGQRRFYLYDFADVVAEYDAKGKMTRSYTHGPEDDDVLATHANGKSSYYHYDSVRSIIAMTGAKGEVVAKYRYGAFGEVRHSEGKASRWNPYGFTSRRRDPAAGLIYFRARFYMTSIGRFTSQDPAGFFDGPNRYSYARNNPILHNDPYGLWSVRGLWNKTVSVAKSATKSVVSAAKKTWEVTSTAATHIGKNPVAFAKGFGKGLYNGAKGIVNMVVHPVETFNGIKHAIVNFSETKEALGELWGKYKKAYAEDPAAFADMSGQILGELTLAIAGTKGLDKVAKLKTLSNLAKAGSKVSKATGVTRAAGAVGTKVAKVGRAAGTRLASTGRQIGAAARNVGAKVARRFPVAAAAARIVATNATKIGKAVKDVAAKRVARAKAINRATQMRKARIAALGGNFLVRTGRSLAALPGQVLKAGKNFIRDPGAFLGYGAFATTRATLNAVANMAKMGRHVGVYGTFPANIVFRKDISESIDRYKNRGAAAIAVEKETRGLLSDAEDLSPEEFARRLAKASVVYDDYRNTLIKPVRDASNAYNAKIQELTDASDDEDPLAILSRFEQASREWANSHEGLLRQIYDGHAEVESAYDNPSANRSTAYENETEFLTKLDELDLSPEAKKAVQERLQDVQYRRGVEYGLYHSGYHEQLVKYMATGELDIEGLEEQIPGMAAEAPSLNGEGEGSGTGRTSGMTDELGKIFEDN